MFTRSTATIATFAAGGSFKNDRPIYVTERRGHGQDRRTRRGVRRRVRRNDGCRTGRRHPLLSSYLFAWRRLAKIIIQIAEEYVTECVKATRGRNKCLFMFLRGESRKRFVALTTTIYSTADGTFVNTPQIHKLSFTNISTEQLKNGARDKSMILSKGNVERKRLLLLSGKTV